MDSMRTVLSNAIEWQDSLEDEDDGDPNKHFGLGRHTLNPADILTSEELAGRLKVPESWIFEKTRARCRNPIPSLQLGRYVRFDWAAVVAWLHEGAAAEEKSEKSTDNSHRR
jgi:hypothetical protein